MDDEPHWSFVATSVVILICGLLLWPRNPIHGAVVVVSGAVSCAYWRCPTEGMMSPMLGLDVLCALTAFVVLCLTSTFTHVQKQVVCATVCMYVLSWVLALAANGATRVQRCVHFGGHLLVIALLSMLLAKPA